MSNKKIGFSFLIIAFTSLIIGLFFGMIGGLQYVLPEFLREALAFQKTRPLHVFLVTQWISCCAVGCIYYFMPGVANRQLYFPTLGWLHFALTSFIIVASMIFFFSGNFSGREYMEFPLWIAGLMIVGWILMLVNFIATVRPAYHTAPVYIWSWTAGMVFFIITISESLLWSIDHFNNNIVRDITVQWKALGSMVGAWNMLVYGCTTYLMFKTTGKKELVQSKLTFFFFFLGLTNLMFNWGHHTYVVPASPVIKAVSYIISMTELLILFQMITKWKKTFLQNNSKEHFSYRLINMADRWILLNLTLAIIISVPFINQYTHGTHITVAHAMGATIGINTTLLFSAAFYVYYKEKRAAGIYIPGVTKKALLVFNISLLVFWVALIASGIAKSKALLQHKGFYEVMGTLKPYFNVFMLSGFVLMFAIIVMAAPICKFLLRFVMQKKQQIILQREEQVMVKRHLEEV
jgi:nitric oxide reductase subunit B